MISLSDKQWFQKKININTVEKIKQDFNFSDILSRLIVLRNYDISEIHYIDNKIEIPNEFIKNKDFIQATDILINSIKKNENICILGDYDVDGTASTSLLVRFLNSINHPSFYYIPDREKDGYGASIKLFKKLILKKPDLIIMVDCGSTSNEAINFLKQNNIKSLIIDHHEINKPYPKANAIINPKKNDGYIKYDYLCATSLTYFFLDILIKKIKSTYDLSSMLVYVLLATVCDVMPLRKINKLIATNVIKDFKIKKNIAFNTLFELNKKDNKLTIDDLGFYVGPIINAGGRLGKSSYGTELLTSDLNSVVKEKSIELIRLNEKRKFIEKNILNEINFKKITNENKNVVIYYNKNLNEGLIGIIAARLKDYFNKPSIVITNSNNMLKGSSRSTINYNIGTLMKKLIETNIIESGGGHNLAAGFTMRKDKIEIFKKFVLKDFLEKNNNLDNYNNYDSEISPSAINKIFYNEINKMGPFGNGNPLPIFFIKDLKILKTIILKNKHISAILKPKIGSTIRSICFNCVDTEIGNQLLSKKKRINIIGNISENIWNNKKTIQLKIKDILI